MRVHRLELTAFGPFSGTEVIDFDALNDSGFFLLTGPTGAGKTSVLDAICFGLFGAVPGVRNTAKDLKSHHAGPRDQPVVELELTLRDRRFRFRRTPAWRRASTRARSGFVDENASVQAAELVDGAWVSRGTRLDEVGLLVSGLVGMNKDQFCQVVMLPQGQFETFLRAGAKERHDVLEALFQTGRFQQIERWLGEHRRRTEASSRAHEEHIKQLLARAVEANGSPWCDPETATLDAAAGLSPVVAELGPQVDALRAAWSDATTAAKHADHTVSEALQVSQRQEAHASARRSLHELDAVHDVVDQRIEDVARARLADKLVPVLELLDEAAAQQAAATTALRIAFAAARDCGALTTDDLSTDSARATADLLRARSATLTSAADIDAAVVAADSTAETTAAELLGADTDLAAVQDSLAALPELLQAARLELTSATSQAARVEALQLRHTAAIRTHKAAAGLPMLRRSIEAARDSERAAHDRQLDARSELTDIRAARINGMAVHLAAALREDEDCPVCGSQDHPRPATAGPHHVTESDEAAAETRFGQADEALIQARSHVADLERALADALDLSGGVDEPTAATTLRTTRRAVRDAEDAAGLAVRLTAQIDALDTRLQSGYGRVVDLTARRDSLRVRLEQQREVLAELVARRVALLPDGDSVAAALALVDEQLMSLEACMQADSALRTADKALAAQRSSFAGCLASSSFADADALRAAVMSAADIATDESLIRTHAEQRAVALARLEDPLLAAAAQAPAPDLTVLGGIAEDAHRALEAATEDYRRADHRHERLLELSATLQVEVDAWIPIQAAADLAATVAAMCAGTSADNQTRTKLSHYVLAARLQQVVDAANLRLLSISSGRYQLLHTMLRGVGDTRGGLGLRVLDTYTGQERDPATLSGGETFYVSLALALGLADLVRDEIGGTELSTLFVDEGFGSLDADTLDEVLDEVDSLRSGGRSVGLVSHLEELRRRIPTQVRIVSSHHGSTVSVV